MNALIVAAWVLIYSMGTGTNKPMHSIYFQTQEACQAAVAKMRDDDRRYAFCVPTGASR